MIRRHARVMPGVEPAISSADGLDDGESAVSEHTRRIVTGVVVLILGTLVLNLDSGLGLVGAFVNLVGGVILLVGIVGAGVQAGNREMVAELRRPSNERRSEVVDQ